MSKETKIEKTVRFEARTSAGTLAHIFQTKKQALSWMRYWKKRSPVYAASITIYKVQVVQTTYREVVRS